MKNYLHLLSFVIAIIVLCSFTSADKPNFIGVYGVAINDPSSIKLIINSDHTFEYHEVTAIAGTIHVTGTWEEKRQKVHLISESSAEFHRVWSFSDNGQMAKSRKGMCFYSLCRK